MKNGCTRKMNKLSFAIAGALCCLTTGNGFAQDSVIQPFSVNKNVVNKSPVNVNSASGAIKPQSNNVADNGVYIIELSSPAVLTYNGGIENFSATNPERNASVRRSDNSKINLASASVAQYRQYLRDQQNKLVNELNQQVGTLKVIAQHQLASNTIIAKLSSSQLQAVTSHSSVKSVTPDRIRKKLTYHVPTMVGAESVWQLPALSGSSVNYGEGVVVGVLDTGINTDHPSFAATDGDGYTHSNPLGNGVYLGDCAGDFPQLCNDKLIGVYSYPTVTNSYSDTSVFPPGLARNGEDYDGHGSHVAATAAGNLLFNVAQVAPDYNTEQSDGIATGFKFAQLSGVAPRANLISFQVCGPGEEDTYSGCPDSAMIAAVEDTIELGIVDVLNFSISGGGFPWSGTLNNLWLNARNAGIFVAEAAGNDGPLEGTTEKHAPWTTSVAATTHGYTVDYEKSIGNFSGGNTNLRDLSGQSATTGVTAAIVYAGDVPNPNDPNGDPAQCLEPYPAGTFNGEIVVCDRGDIPRVEKAFNVAQGGAGGYVLANVEGGDNTLYTDTYVIPGIHIDLVYSNALRNWLASGSGHTGTITSAVGTLNYNASGDDNLTAFSSRGPNSSISVLAPSISAPGDNIYAAFADENYGRDQSEPAPSDFSYLSGTSMASPVVAGSAALLKARNPQWTPDNIRSALMTTAVTEVNNHDGETEANWLQMGAGRVQVDAAASVSLLMDESSSNYASANPDLGGDPRQLNVPSITDNECLGTCTWSRTFTAVTAGSWNVATQSLTDGLDITVEPEQFSLSAGQSITLDVSIDSFRASNNNWAFGSVMLDDGNNPVQHIPVSVVATKGNFPQAFNIEADRDSYSALYPDIRSIEIESFSSQAYALVKPDSERGTVTQDSNNDSVLDDLEDGIYLKVVDVPSNSKRLYVDIYDSTAPDLDLYVFIDSNNDGFLSSTELVAESLSFDANETIDIMSPPAGEYHIVVQNWEASSALQDTFTLDVAVIDDTPSDALRVTGPSSTAPLESFDLTLQWTLPDAQVKDTFIGVVGLSSTAEQNENLGLFPVNITRVEDDVSVTANGVTRVEPGASTSFAINVAPNYTNLDRDYEITVDAPKDTTLAENFISDNGVVSDNSITWRFTQPALGRPDINVAVVTNTAPSTCRVPDAVAQAPLAETSLPTDNHDMITMSYQLSDPVLAGLGNHVTVFEDGVITLGQPQVQPWKPRLLSDAQTSDILFAPLWRDFMVTSETSISVNQYQGKYTVVAWSGLASPTSDDGLPQSPQAASFKVIFNNQPNDGEASFMYVYDELPADSAKYSVGYKLPNVSDTLHYRDPIANFNSGSIAADLDQIKAVCFYPSSVSSSGTRLTFGLTASEDHAGGPIEVSATSIITNVSNSGTATTAVYSDVEVEGAPSVTINGTTSASLSGTENGTLTLAAVATDPNSDLLTVTWEQISGPSLSFSSTTSINTSVTLPSVEAATTALVQVTVSDASGRQATAQAQISIAVATQSSGGGGTMSVLGILLLGVMGGIRSLSKRAQQ